MDANRMKILFAFFLCDTFRLSIPREYERRTMNSNSYKFQTAIFSILLGLIFSTAVFAQDEMTAVTRSELVGVSLPSGALRVNEGHVPADITQTMQKLIAEGGAKIRQGDTEVLVWTGNDLKKTGVDGMVQRVTKAFATGGWQYEVSATEDGITFFTLLKDGPQKRAMLGVHGESDGTLLFALTEMLAANGGSSTPSRPSTSTPATTAVGGSVSDYSFTTPTGWSRSDSAGKISLTTQDGEKAIVFLPPMDTTGDLERDAERILWQVFNGYESWSGNGFTPEYGQFEKGKTAQGLEYYRAVRYAAQRGAEDSYRSKIDANILLVKLGGKVAVIVGQQPFQTDGHNDSATFALDRILYDLKFKSLNPQYNLKSEIVGSWSAASSTVGLAYTFNANGTFNKGGAISFRTSHDATRDKVTTTSYGMTDSYSLAGNIITQTYKRTGEVSKYKVRVYSTKYDTDAWVERLGFLPVADPDSGTVVFRKSR